MPPTRRDPKKCKALRHKKNIKSAYIPMNTGASSSSFNSNCSAANRLSKVKITKEGEAASINYLTNAAGQQVFKSEPKPDQYLPSATELGTGFIAWLKMNFGWLYAQAQTDASLGSAYTYADGQLPSWAVLGEYDNGSASGAGRTEYIWLPTEDGGAVPVGMFRNSKFFAIHSDHLGTPRLMTDSLNKPVWQWPYSAFGNNKPTGILKPTATAAGAFTNQPVLLATQNPAATLDLRFPGQMADVETGLFYNYFRSYQPSQGRYTQGDPIGLAGGLNRFGYVGGNALSRIDPLGLAQCFYDVAGGLLHCVSEDPASGGFAGGFTSGNNNTPGCKDNPDCANKPNVGPIPQGCYSWGGAGRSDGLNRRRLLPLPGNSTSNRSSFQTHCCSRKGEGNPFESSNSCSEGCVVGYCSTVKDLYDFLDKEKGGNTLCVY